MHPRGRGVAYLWGLLTRCLWNPHRIRLSKDRYLSCDSRRRGFESRHPPQIKKPRLRGFLDLGRPVIAE